jgi:predicted dehydrogenase
MMGNLEKGAGGRGKVRIASIGAGMIGQVHAAVLSRLEECEYVALCDSDPYKAKMAASLGIAYYSDYREMLDKEKPDGVVISLPNEAHELVGTECADKGAHIFMEKPIAPTLESADALIASARKNNVKLLVGHHRRFNAHINAVRDMVRSGELGDLVGVNVLWSMYKPSEYFEVGAWRRKKGGGPLLINTIHEIDDLRYICGEIGRVYAEVSNKARGFEVEDTVSVSVRFKDGTLASILMSDSAPSLWGYECTMGENPFFYPTKGDIYHYLGKKASLTFPGMIKVFYADNTKVGWQYPLTTEHIEVEPCDPYVEQMRHFCHVIHGDESPRTSGEDARRTLEVIMAVAKSGRTGKAISI